MSADRPDTTVQVCLLLGSNINPVRNLPRAVAELAGRMPLLKTSRVWKTPPVGGEGEDFLNLAALVRTALKPKTIKYSILRPLEQRMGRMRSADKFAPRTIDIDVIVWDDQVVDPALWKYAHVAVPVAELLPDLRSPTGAERLEVVAARLRRTTAMQVCDDLDLQDCYSADSGLSSS